MNTIQLKARINEHDLCYQIEGNPKNESIIFIHGFPFNQSIWDNQVEILKNDFRVITYDIRGHGQSELGTNELCIELFADDLIELMNHLKIGKAIVCGLSIGGYILFNAYSRFPGRFKALILNDTKCDEDNINQKINRLNAIKSIESKGLVDYANESLTKLFTKEHLKSQQSKTNFIKELILKTDKKTIENTLLALAKRHSTCFNLKNIEIPTLIIFGEEDQLTPIAIAKSMGKQIPNSKTVIIKNAAHLPNLENEIDFNAAIYHFLTQINSNNTNPTMINQKILELTNLIRDKYPELLKYLNEMPVSIPDEEIPEVQLAQLKAYYVQLQSIVKQYQETHEPKT
jgi:3-oxoadipate enol-lactonase